ncbi:MAG: transcription termination/antitermination protein NusG [Bacilli bacterium]
MVENKDNLTLNGEETVKTETSWYVASTQSGHENKVKSNLENRIVNTPELNEFIKQILVAEIELDVMGKNGLPSGKKKMKNLYPGYVFIEMKMSDEAWFVVRNTPGVTGFIGSSGRGAKPFPVPTEEIEPVLKRLGLINSSMYDRYQVDDEVRVVHGSLEGTHGRILDIDKTTGIIKLETVFFGRPTVLEVDFADIEKE